LYIYKCQYVVLVVLLLVVVNSPLTPNRQNINMAITTRHWLGLLLAVN